MSSKPILGEAVSRARPDSVSALGMVSARVQTPFGGDTFKHQSQLVCRFPCLKQNDGFGCEWFIWITLAPYSRATRTSAFSVGSLAHSSSELWPSLLLKKRVVLQVSTV